MAVVFRVDSAIVHCGHDWWKRATNERVICACCGDATLTPHGAFDASSFPFKSQHTKSKLLVLKLAYKQVPRES